MLPLLVGLVVLLMRMNMAVQISIVNQQYARAQAHFLTFNSPVYPELRLRRHPGSRDFLPTNRMILGVSENSPEEGDQRYRPEATEQMVARSRGLAGRKPDPGEESRETGFVRVRNTVALCTQSNVVNIGGKIEPLNATTVLEGRVKPSNFEYCRSPLDEQ